MKGLSMDLNQPLLFSALLLLQAVLCQTQSKMIVPPQPIVVPVGSDVTLPCEVDSVKNLKDLVVEWARPDLKPRYVHIRRDGLDLLIDQNSLYQGRTRLSERGLQVGDMSLKLSRVRLSDGGKYRCFLPQMDTAGEVTLTVVSVSPVAVSLTKDHSGSRVLRCESRGWYPEPELLWLDSDGTVLTGGRTEVQRGVSDETFSVSSRLSVEQSPGNTFTCRVRQQQSRQSRENQITVTDEFLEVPPVPSCSVAWTLFSLGLCLLIAAAAAFVVWKFQLLNRGKKSENEDTELGERAEQENLLKPEEELTEHKENLEKIQDELKFVKDVINKLTETKEFLMKLKEKPQKVINQVDSEIAVRKNKLNEPHWNVLKDKVKKRKEKIEELGRHKKEWEEEIVKIDSQIKAIEEMILEVTQRKGQLEAQFKNMKKLLKNNKRIEAELQQHTNMEEEKQIKEAERPKVESVTVIQEIEQGVEAIEDIILEATQRKEQVNGTKQTETEKRRPEAAAGPEPQPPSDVVKVNVPMATVKDLDPTPGAQGENREEQENTALDVDGIINGLEDLSLHNKKENPSTGQVR